MRIPDHIVEQVKTQANILDVVGASVKMRKAGRNYLGLCPFHKEKTPSFNVSVERGIYKCFGCGKSGDSIAFIQETLNVGFIEAVKILADKMGIVIPEEEFEDPTGMNARRDAALKTLEAAALHFHHVLISNPNNPVRKFFSKRGFTDGTIENFMLGASEQRWDGLMKHLQHQGFTQEHMEDAGLIVRNDSGRVYDRFRGRAMFALKDAVGRVVGFSARQIDPSDTMAKYINSPQTMVFDKSKVLYGLDLAKRQISQHRTALVVEGQADVISMHQAGFNNTVASSGTALTADHLRLLKKYADNIKLVFDADNAGQNAMSRSIELCLQTGFNVSCVPLPPESDPDSIIHDQGQQAMQDLLDASLPWIEFQYRHLEASQQLDDSAAKGSALKTMVGWIASVPEKLQHPFLLKELAERFSVDEHILKSAIAKVDVPSRTATQPPATNTVVVEESADPIVAMILPPERTLLHVALNLQDGLALLLNEFHVSEDTFYSLNARNIFQLICDAEHEHHDVSSALLESNTISEDLRNTIREIVTSNNAPSRNWAEFSVDVPEIDRKRPIFDALFSLRVFRIDRVVQQAWKKIEGELNDDDRQRLLVRISKSVERREQLKKKFLENPMDPSWLDVEIV